MKHFKAIVLRPRHAHPWLPAERLQQLRSFCGVHRGCAHQFRLAHQALQPKSCNWAEQHSLGGLLLPIAHGLLVVAVIGARQRQPNIQIRQINGGA